MLGHVGIVQSMQRTFACVRSRGNLSHVLHYPMAWFRETGTSGADKLDAFSGALLLLLTVVSEVQPGSWDSRNMSILKYNGKQQLVGFVGSGSIVMKGAGAVVQRSDTKAPR